MDDRNIGLDQTRVSGRSQDSTELSQSQTRESNSCDRPAPSEQSDLLLSSHPRAAAMSDANEFGQSPLSRRTVLASLAGLGLGTVAFQRSLAAQAEQSGQVTPEMITQAEWI